MKQRSSLTGGAGFIGSAVVRHLIIQTEHHAVNIDKLTYAGNLDTLREVDTSQRYSFAQADICDADAIHNLFDQYQPAAIMHLAAESHVDRPIDGPSAFIQTNVAGTGILLEVSREYSCSNPEFRFHHVSADEVYGDLEPDEAPFTETHAYKPSSPYDASKAAADHLVHLAWRRERCYPHRSRKGPIIYFLNIQI